MTETVHAPAPRIVVVCGPSGSGKSTVGRAGAALAGAAFVEADDHHSGEARARMAAGIGLTDAERAPWLDRVAAAVRALSAPRVVVACSALNEAVRARLDAGLPSAPTYLLLDAPPDELARRLASRAGHFAGESLLSSQLEALRPEGVERLDATKPPAELAAAVAARLTTASTPGSPRTA